MKKIIWIGEERILPAIGLASKDKSFLLADDIADSYVKQKLAKYEEMPAKVSKEKESK